MALGKAVIKLHDGDALEKNRKLQADLGFQLEAVVANFMAMTLNAGERL